MSIYNIRFYNDMGHLRISKSGEIPDHINKFIYSKASMYLYNATDRTNLGCRFYILKPEFKKYWTYYHNNDIINIIYDVDLFDSNRMKINLSINFFN